MSVLCNALIPGYRISVAAEFMADAAEGEIASTKEDAFDLGGEGGKKEGNLSHMDDSARNVPYIDTLGRNLSSG